MRTFRRVKPLSYISVAISLLVVSVTMVFFIISISYNRLELESRRVRDQYFAYQKKVIKNQVESISDNINYYKKKSENDLKSDVRQKIYIIYDMMYNYYDENRDKSKDILRAEIAELVKGVRSNSLIKYHYTIWLDDQGKPETRSNHEGITTDMKPFEVDKAARDMIQQVREEGEGFYEYFWCEEEECIKKNSSHRKLAFVKYFEELNMIIGTGIYADDMEKVVKKELIDHIASTRYDEGGYFYVVTYDGVALVFADEEYLGTDVSGINDINGVNIHSEEMKQITTYGEGYVKYTWTKLGLEGVFPKLSFVKGLDDWQWIIGTGVYLDEIEETITMLEQDVKKEITENLAKVLVVIGLLALFFLFFQYHVVRKIINLLQQEDEIHSIITDLSVDGILIVNKQGKILESNRKGMDLMGISYRSVKEIRVWDMFQDEIFQEDSKKPHIFKETSLMNLNGDTIPVEVHMKLTIVDRQKVYITYLRDLTKRYRYEKKLEELALMDELTGVYNRRFIIGQIERGIIQHKDSGQSMAIAMADLDFFKKVNDTYGHTYGDDILKYFTKMLKEYVRPTDFVGRYGGEEFIVIFTSQTKEEAYEVLHNIQLKIKKHIFEKKELKLTFSAGIVELHSNTGQDIRDYLIEVDKLLYKAKENGRDRIELQ